MLDVKRHDNYEVRIPTILLILVSEFVASHYLNLTHDIEIVSRQIRLQCQTTPSNTLAVLA